MIHKVFYLPILIAIILYFYFYNVIFIEGMNSAISSIVLLGDSIFQNSNYVPKDKSIEYLLKERLPIQSMVLAQDNATINLLYKQYPDPSENVGHVVDHIDHIVKIAGIDHVGIGCDFDGGGGIDGIFDVSEIKNITVELVRRGYNEVQFEKIWGGNLIRVFREVQAYAKNAGTSSI